MLKTVADYKDSVAAILSGLDLSNVDNQNGAFERAARTMIQKADIPEASQIQNITLFAGVYDYLCDQSIFGTAINDIRPQGISRNYSDTVVKTDQELFDRTKKWYPSGTRSTFQYQNGKPIIRIVAPFPKQQVIINRMSATSGWTASGTASGLAQDMTNFYEAPASLRFNLGAGIGVLSNTLQSPLSMANQQGVGTGFLAIQIPQGSDPTTLTNIALKLGSDAANYSTALSSAGFLGAWIANEWLLVPFDFSKTVDTGTPNWAAIQYVEVDLNATGDFINFHVGGLFMSLSSPAQILFQSAAIFLPAGASVPLTTITDDTDQIILSDPAYTIYEFEGALSILQQTGAGASDNTSLKIMGMLDGTKGDIGLYARYRGDNPSQEIRQTGVWYENNNGYNNWIR